MEILFSLYKGKVEGKFLGPTPEMPNRHIYMIDGKRKTGVTTYLGIKDKSGPLMIWQGEETAKHLFEVLEKGEEINHEVIIKAIFAHKETLAKAADLGTMIHGWIEEYINHRLNPRKIKMPDMPEDPNVVTGVPHFSSGVCSQGEIPLV